MTKGWLGKLPLGLLLPGVIVLQGCQELGVHDAASLLVPTLKRSDIIGMIAGFGTTFAGLPDLLAMLKRRSSAGMNPRMAGIMCLFQFAWVYYGLLILSPPVVLWNLIGIVTNGMTVGAFVYFLRKEKSQVKS